MIIILWLFNIAMENDPFIDGLPIKNGGFFHSYVSLPEGILDGISLLAYPIFRQTHRDETLLEHGAGLMVIRDAAIWVENRTQTQNCPENRIYMPLLSTD